MYLNCAAETSANKQRLLEQALLDAMQREIYDDISVSDLCRSSGVSRKTFYRLFSGKVDVLYALVDHTLLDFENYTPTPAVKEGGMYRFLAFWKDNKPLLDALCKNSASGLLTERALLHILRDDPERVHEFGVENPEYAREMMLFYISGMFSLVIDWYANGYQRSVDEMSRLFNTILQKSPVNPWEF